MIKTILTDVMTSLSSIKEIRYVAQDWGQLDMERPPMQWPCALIDITDISYTQLAGKNMNATCTINIVLCSDIPQRISARAAKEMNDNTLAHYTLLDDVIKTMQGHSGESFTRLALKTCRNIRPQGLQAHELSFETTFKVLVPAGEAFDKTIKLNIIAS